MTGRPSLIPATTNTGVPGSGTLVPRRGGTPRRRAVAAPRGPVNLVVADASPLLRAGVRLLLEGHLDRVRLRRSAEDADVVLLDAAYRTGPLRLCEGAAPLVVVVRDGDLATTRLVRAAGATAVPAGVSAETLVAAVESAHRQRRRPDRSATPAPEVTWGDDPVDPLSSREEQVLAGICAGLSNDQIAAELYVSINSVKTYVRSAYRKMGVARRGQAIVWGMQRGYGGEPDDGGSPW